VDVQKEIVRRYGADVSFALSVEGPTGWKSGGPARYVLLNTATFLYPVRAGVPAPAGRVLTRYEHPLQFLPYQYEVYGAATRAIVQSTDISMRLIDTWSPSPPTRAPSTLLYDPH